MTRITTTILAVMLLANGTVTIMAASGLNDDLGVELAPGVSDQMDQLISELKAGFRPDIGVIESLVSVVVAAGRFFLVLIQAVYALPSMLMNLGFPSWIVVPLFAPMYLVSTMEMIFILTGRNPI